MKISGVTEVRLAPYGKVSCSNLVGVNIRVFFLFIIIVIIIIIIVIVKLLLLLLLNCYYYY